VFGRAACIAAVCVASTAQAQSEPDVPLLVVGELPADFELARFASALDTYVVGARVTAAPIASTDDANACARALERAITQASPIALWARWADDALVLSLVRVTGGCGAIAATTADVAPDQRQFIYRVAALKVASMVREAIAAAPVVEAPRRVAPAPVVEASWATLVELGAAGDASTAESERRFFAVATARAGKLGWYVGPMIQASVPQSRDVPGASGRAFQLTALAAVGRTLLERAGWSLDADVGVGVAYVWSTGQRDGGPAMEEQVWIPTASVAPRVRFDIASRVAITAGIGVDLALRTVRLTLGDMPLYEAGHVQLRWDLRAQLRF